jgi:hypothetical protein
MDVSFDCFFKDYKEKEFVNNAIQIALRLCKLRLGAGVTISNLQHNTRLSKIGNNCGQKQLKQE